MNESWKTVDGFDNYEVSTEGRVRNSLTGSLLTGTPKDGYRQVNLKNREGKRGGPFVHRLVAMAFLGAPQPGQVVCHLSGIKDDDRVENLCWMSREESIRHTASLGRDRIARGEANGKAKLSDEKVAAIRIMRRKGVTAKSLGESFGVHPSTVVRADLGQTWGHAA